MPRKVKQRIEINNEESLSGLMQETYNDACLQIKDAQSMINTMAVGLTPSDVDDETKIVKEKAGLLKIKDSAIKIKLEIAKLQSDIIKNGGNVDGAITDRTHGEASLNDFKSIREMFKVKNTDNEE
jgi:hypothetical protein